MDGDRRNPAPHPPHVATPTPPEATVASARVGAMSKRKVSRRLGLPPPPAWTMACEAKTATSGLAGVTDSGLGSSQSGKKPPRDPSVASRKRKAPPTSTGGPVKKRKTSTGGPAAPTPTTPATPTTSAIPPFTFDAPPACLGPSSSSPATGQLHAHQVLGEMPERVRKMYKRKGGFQSSSNKKQKTCENSQKTKDPCLAAFEEEFGSIDDYGQDAWKKLNKKVAKNLSEAVVALASFRGNQMHFGCTGIVVRSNVSGVGILTSASLVMSLDGERDMTSILTIEVRLPNNQIAGGIVAHYDFHYNVVVIVIPPFPDLRAAHFDLHKEFESYSKVVAVGCWFYSGKFMATAGILTDEPSEFYPEHLRISTCKIPTVMTGGPLIDMDGNMAGMNFCSMERTPLLPWDKIFDFLVLKDAIELEGPELILESAYESPCWSKIEHEAEPNLKSRFESHLRSFMLDSEGSSNGYSEPEDIMDAELFADFYNPIPDDEFIRFVKNDLRLHGYPMPTRLEGGMRLVNTFEEEFAEDTLCKLSKRVASNAARSVVSLASFKEGQRFFACTGVFIDFNGSTSSVLTSASLVPFPSHGDERKVFDLEISVYLPTGRTCKGVLKHYNLTYNVAVVDVVGFRCLRTADFCNPVRIKPNMEVIAVGRVFRSGKLMASSGIVTAEGSKLDCKELMIATCKITKAGIGGPLSDIDGNFIGMNFYGTKETHFLPKDCIVELLKNFDSEWAVADEPNRWPVPEVPRWSYPSNKRPRSGGVEMLL